MLLARDCSLLEQVIVTAIRKLLRTLGQQLDTRGRQFKQEVQSRFFLLNNWGYALRAVEGSSVASLIGQEW